jgi:hypothetical protein
MAKVTFDKDGLAKVSGTLTVYSFDAKTGEYTGTTEEYLAPGVGIPANACTVAPPEADQGKVAVFNDGSWLLVADHRGEKIYSTKDGQPAVVTETGDYPENTTVLAPLTVFDVWNGDEWVTDATAQSAAQVREAEAKKASLIAAANETTQAWQAQLMLGIITDADKAALTEWMKYIQKVQSTATESAPDITWPQQPE